jgi:protein-tyrosine phosphatase
MQSNQAWPLVDIHAHVLPGVDDGPRNAAQTRALLGMAKDVGIVTVVATPHLKQDLDARYQEVVARGIAVASPECALAQIELVSGFEVLVQPSVIYRVDAGDQLCLNGSRYMLVELPFEQWPLFTESVLFELETSGIRPILAHPERYVEAIADPSKIFALAERGVLMQVTWASLTGVLGKGPLKLARKMIEANIVDIVATDAHSDGRRLASVPEAVAVLNDWVGPDRAYQMAVSNPAAVIADHEIAVPIVPAASESSGHSTKRWKFW